MSDKFELYIQSISKERNNGDRAIGDKFFFGKYKGVDFDVVHKEYPWYISYIYTKEFSEPMEFEKARFRSWWNRTHGVDASEAEPVAKKRSKLLRE